MSEFEREDLQVMGVVNAHAAPEAAEQAEQIARDLEALRQVPEKVADNPVKQEDDAENWRQKAEEDYQRTRKKCLRKIDRKMAIGVGLCLLVAALFGIALAVPEFVVWLVNLGVLNCGIIAGIITDRCIRKRKAWIK